MISHIVMDATRCCLDLKATELTPLNQGKSSRKQILETCLLQKSQSHTILSRAYIHVLQVAERACTTHTRHNSYHDQKLPPIKRFNSYMTEHYNVGAPPLPVTRKELLPFLYMCIYASPRSTFTLASSHVTCRPIYIVHCVDTACTTH